MNGAYYLCSRKLGVKENMLDVLYALDDGAPHTQKQICGDWLIPKTTVNTIVKELVSDGFAELLPVEGGREKIIRLTADGRRWAAALMQSLHDAETAALMKTVEKFSGEYIEAFEYFSECFSEEVKKLPQR